MARGAAENCHGRRAPFPPQTRKTRPAGSPASANMKSLPPHRGFMITPVRIRPAAPAGRGRPGAPGRAARRSRNPAQPDPELRRGGQRRDAGGRLLHAAGGLHGRGRRAADRRRDAHRRRPVLAGAHPQPDDRSRRGRRRRAHRPARPAARRRAGARGAAGGARRHAVGGGLHAPDRAGLPHRRPRAPRRAHLPGQRPHAGGGADRGAGLQLLPGRVPRHVPHRGADPRRDRRARLEPGGRLPDPQPDAPRARGAVQDRAGVGRRRRRPDPHAARPPQARRHPSRGARRPPSARWWSCTSRRTR